MAYSTFDVRYPQWLVEVDPSKCKRAGITPDQVLSTLSGYYGGQYVSNFNRFSKVYKVMIQSDPQYRLDEASLNNTFVRMSNGEMAPLSQFLTLTRTYGAESLSRFNMYNSIAVNAMPADGYSTGDAIRAVQENSFHFPAQRLWIRLRRHHPRRESAKRYDGHHLRHLFSDDLPDPEVHSTKAS